MKKAFTSRMMRLSCVLLLLGSTACTTPTELYDFHPRDDVDPRTIKGAESIFSGRTFVFHNRFHGTQIEYHAPNGRSALWYPGNTGTVPANWKVVPAVHGSRDHRICYQYPSASYNPVTRSNGGQFECTGFATFTNDLRQIVSGDPFALASGRVPYRLPKGDFYAQDLAQKAQISLNKIKTIYRKD
ncbi:MAG: hypothetical protein ABJM43_06325 [Paracoccaceae bacterium]